MKINVQKDKYHYGGTSQNKLKGVDKEGDEHYFHELKESEEERNQRIKKEVVEMLHYYHSKSPCAIPLQFSLEETLAWLEKQGEQKLSWSEEDEKMFNSALWHVKNSCGNGGKNSGEFEVYNWLKSLKDRVQLFKSGYDLLNCSLKYVRDRMPKLTWDNDEKLKERGLALDAPWR